VKFRTRSERSGTPCVFRPIKPRSGLFFGSTVYPAPSLHLFPRTASVRWGASFFCYLIRLVLLISDFELPDTFFFPLGLPVLRSPKISFPLFVSEFLTNSPFFERVPHCFPHMHVLRLYFLPLSLNVKTTPLPLSITSGLILSPYGTFSTHIW